jgi:hypothetical protein
MPNFAAFASKPVNFAQKAGTLLQNIITFSLQRLAIQKIILPV